MSERKKLITICVPVYNEEQNADHSTTRFCVSWRRSPFRIPFRVYSPVLLLSLPQHPEAFCKLDVRRSHEGHSLQGRIGRNCAAR
jgi:hypothetical protein